MKKTRYIIEQEKRALIKKRMDEWHAHEMRKQRIKKLFAKIKKLLS